MTPSAAIDVLRTLVANPGDAALSEPARAAMMSRLRTAPDWLDVWVHTHPDGGITASFAREWWTAGPDGAVRVYQR